MCLYTRYYKLVMQNRTNSHKKYEFVSSLNKLREEISKLLPINNSFIRYDLLNLVMLYELEGKELSFKELYTSVNHSDIGIRNNVIKLQEAGWVEVTESKHDGRSRVIAATDKLHRCYEQLSDALRSTF